MIVSCLVIWRSATGFEIASDYLDRKLSHGVKVATINTIASSMPEFLSSFFFIFYLKDANKGNYDDAISNALGLPLLFYTLLYGPIEMEPLVVELSTELWMFLLITTILGAILFNLERKLTLWKAGLFILIYLLFVLYVVGHAFGMPLAEVVPDALKGFADWLKNLF